MYPRNPGKQATAKKTSFESMVDLKSSLNNSDVGGVDIFGNTTELSNIFGNTTELFNGTNSLESNISLDHEEPFVIQNGKVKSIDCIEDLAGISTKLCPLLLV